MDRIQLNAEIREELGKNRTKKLRSAGVVPACIYKHGKEAKNLKIDKRALFEVLHTKAGENVIIDLTIKGDESKMPRPVMIKEVQYHPIKDDVLHVDFSEISLTEKIKVDIPVVTKGEPEAVHKEDGTLEHIMWELEVECLPTEIPEKIEVDVSKLEIGDKIHVKDLSVPFAVKILNDPELTVLSAEPPHAEEEPAEEALEGEEEGVEPDLIKKGKKEEEEGGEEEAEEAPKAEKKEEKKE